MRKGLLSLLLLLVSLLGSLALEDLERKAFVFPVASNTAHVVLKAKIQHPLTSVTLCLRLYTDLTREHSLFSYASKRHSNELLLVAQKPNQYKFHLGSEELIFKVPETLSTNHFGKHVCVSWESSTGLVELWVNGQPLVRKSLAKGHSIQPEASIVLGQDQDNFGGGFDINQSFMGEISDVYMWDRVLDPDEVVLAWYDQALPDYLINWRLLNYTIKGYAVVKPALLSVHTAG
ncbi:PREDICTED: serum amyloid P-component-like [Gekko japonicus]|uniref:Pentraxin family member n=1 Tax=Gekko japonicus TaxID=146911 RepID=A0ABM1KYE9_GEKJA|nr:PREDICTED: serum amyloid P-component-like [Gekko japonicus]